LASEGTPKEGVFVAFCASTRNSRLRLSSKWMRFLSARSSEKRLGPVKKLRPVLPSSPAGGAKNCRRCCSVKMKLRPPSSTILPMSGVQPSQLTGDCTTCETELTPE
jgi:hypothetical protein